MAKIIWGILSARVIIDQETNTVSYIDVIENIAAPQFPVTLQRATLSLVWKSEKKGEELTFRIFLNWPGNTDDRVIEPDTQILNTPSHRFNLVLNGIKIEKPGELSFAVKQLINDKWKPVFKFVCPIIQAEEPTTT